MTRAEDVKCAAHYGVDAVGLVFYPPSPRHVDVDLAAQLARAAPLFVDVVALFVDPEPDLVSLHPERKTPFRYFGRPKLDARRPVPDALRRDSQHLTLPL